MAGLVSSTALLFRRRAESRQQDSTNAGQELVSLQRVPSYCEVCLGAPLVDLRSSLSFAQVQAWPPRQIRRRLPRQFEAVTRHTSQEKGDRRRVSFANFTEVCEYAVDEVVFFDEEATSPHRTDDSYSDDSEEEELEFMDPFDRGVRGVPSSPDASEEPQTPVDPYAPLCENEVRQWKSEQLKLQQQLRELQGQLRELQSLQDSEQNRLSRVSGLASIESTHRNGNNVHGGGSAASEASPSGRGALPQPSAPGLVGCVPPPKMRQAGPPQVHECWKAVAGNLDSASSGGASASRPERPEAGSCAGVPRCGALNELGPITQASVLFCVLAVRSAFASSFMAALEAWTIVLRCCLVLSLQVPNALWANGAAGLSFQKAGGVGFAPVRAAEVREQRHCASRALAERGQACQRDALPEAEELRTGVAQELEEAEWADVMEEAQEFEESEDGEEVLPQLLYRPALDSSSEASSEVTATEVAEVDTPPLDEAALAEKSSWPDIEEPEFRFPALRDSRALAVASWASREEEDEEEQDSEAMTVDEQEMSQVLCCFLEEPECPDPSIGCSAAPVPSLAEAAYPMRHFKEEPPQQVCLDLALLPEDGGKGSSTKAAPASAASFVTMIEPVPHFPTDKEEDADKEEDEEEASCPEQDVLAELHTPCAHLPRLHLEKPSHVETEPEGIISEVAATAKQGELAQPQYSILAEKTETYLELLCSGMNDRLSRAIMEYAARAVAVTAKDAPRLSEELLPIMRHELGELSMMCGPELGLGPWLALLALEVASRRGMRDGRRYFQVRELLRSRGRPWLDSRGDPEDNRLPRQRLSWAAKALRAGNLAASRPEAAGGCGCPKALAKVLVHQARELADRMDSLCFQR